MMIMKKYTSFALIAALAATAGWGASALASYQKSNAVSAPQEAVQSTTTPPGVTQSNLLANSPATAADALERTGLVAQPAVSEAAAPMVRTSPRRSRVVNRPLDNGTQEIGRNESREVSRSSAPVYERKSGMSNKTKTAIAIGGGAATGAIIGGIAGGGKGAAIGALIGGGGGAIYSVIRHKQHQPVW